MKSIVAGIEQQWDFVFSQVTRLAQPWSTIDMERTLTSGVDHIGDKFLSDVTQLDKPA